MKVVMTKNIIDCPNKFDKSGSNFYVFLAGPIQGAPDWQHSVPYIKNVTYLSPRRSSIDSKFNYDEQVNWETLGLRSCDVILMWIPKEIESIEGRSYAQTSRFELAENLVRGKKIILGINPDFPGCRYMKLKANKYGVENVHSTLEDCLIELAFYVNSNSSKSNILFTSDTHFGSDRALELSKRPFKSLEDMDLTMVERWNNLVKPTDIIYHLGDFGDLKYRDYLNGEIHLITGNYERDAKSEVPDKIIYEGDDALIDTEIGKLILTHEPSKFKELRNKYGNYPILFGHIHGRQKVKEWNGLDVGVDGNNFQPYTLDDVNFYLNAIDKGYYDDNVWC